MLTCIVPNSVEGITRGEHCRHSSCCPRHHLLMPCNTSVCHLTHQRQPISVPGMECCYLQPNIIDLTMMLNHMQWISTPAKWPSVTACGCLQLAVMTPSSHSSCPLTLSPVLNILNVIHRAGTKYTHTRAVFGAHHPSCRFHWVHCCPTSVRPILHIYGYAGVPFGA